MLGGVGPLCPVCNETTYEDYSKVDLNDNDLISELLKDRDDNNAVDGACYKRLRRLAADYGKDGDIASSLLDVVRRLLDL